MNWTRRQFLQASGSALAGLSLSTLGAPTLLGQSKTALTTAGIFTLTGANAVTGKLIRDGAQVAAQTINDSGGIADRFTIDLAIEDSRTSQTEAVNIANRLASRGDVSFVLGPLISSFGLATQPILASAQIPHIFFGADQTFPDQHDQFPLSITYGSHVATQYAPIVKYAVDIAEQTDIFVITPNTDRGQVVTDTINAQVKRLGRGQVVNSDFYPPFNRDFSTIVTKVRNSDASAMIIGTGIPAEIIAAAQEFERQGIDPDQLGFYTGQTPNGSVQFWEAVADSGVADGFIHSWVYASPDMPSDFETAIPSLESASKMQREFQNVVGRLPNSGQVESWGWGGIKLIKRAIERLVDEEGEQTVAELDPVRQLPQAVVDVLLPAQDEDGAGRKFNTPFGDSGFLPCAQYDTRLGVATFRNGGEQHLVTPRGYGNELIEPLCD